MEGEWWQITDFAVKISETLQQKYNDEKFSVHYNTVDKWFKALETKRIHYINRAAGEKVYDRIDLNIGCFIADARRDNRFRLDVIYEQVPKQLEVRPFPSDFKDENSLGVDESLIERRVIERVTPIIAQQFNIFEEKINLQLHKMMEEQVQSVIKQYLPQPKNEEEEKAKLQELIKEMIPAQMAREEVQSTLKQLLPVKNEEEEKSKLQEAVKKMFPPTLSKQEELMRRKDENLTRMRLEMKLEEEAIQEWNKKSPEERLKRVGIFRKEEDYIKRENFIRVYKKEHLNRVLDEAYTIE
jgi:DNA-binding transcriptional regulator YhcF (GntR family)